MSRKTPAESTAKTKGKQAKTGKSADAQPEPLANSHADWEHIELDYRAGVKTLRQMANENGISEAAIRKRAKREGWTRDLSVRIKAKADELVRKEAVRSEVRTERTASERAVVEANAQAIATIRLSHREDIRRQRDLGRTLLEELERISRHETLQYLDQMGELLTNAGDKNMEKMLEVLTRITSIPGRIDSFKKLAEAVRIVIELERKAFNMDDDDDRPADTLLELLNTITTRNDSAFQPVAKDPEHETDDA